MASALIFRDVGRRLRPRHTPLSTVLAALILLTFEIVFLGHARLQLALQFQLRRFSLVPMKITLASGTDEVAEVSNSPHHLGSKACENVSRIVSQILDVLIRQVRQ
jgi:hypothetical protein